MDKKALIIEDNADEARHVAAALAEMGFSCAIADDGRHGLELARSGGYAIAIIDNMLPSLSGPEVVAELRAGGSRLPIIILSALGKTEHLISGLANGADDYMSKPCSYGELQARVAALLRRTGYVEEKPSSVLVHGDLRVETDVKRVFRAGRLLSLTTTEYGLLEYLVRNAGRIIPPRMIAEQVWGFDAGTSTTLVSTRIAYLRTKIVAAGEDDPIVTRRGFGYGIL